MSRREAAIGIALGLIFAMVSIPMLASSPQNPDGAELVMAALRGGVLHPPGFPVQAWLDRALVTVVPLDTTKVLAVQSLLFSCAAIAILAQVFLRTGLSAVAAAFGVAAFAFYPPAWALAVQPEKYGALFCYLAAFALCCVSAPRARASKRRILGHAALAGALLGLVLSQHLIGIVGAPLAFALLVRIPARSRWPACGAFLLAMASIVAAFYLSMLWLPRPGGWPDWGKLSTVQEVVRHALRRDFPVGADGVDRGGIRGSAVAWKQFLLTYALLGLLLPLGLWAAAKSWARGLFVPYALALAAALAFVSIARIGGDPAVAVAGLERYTALPVLFAVPFMAAGLDWLLKRAPRGGRKLIVGAALVAIVLIAVRARPGADASADGTIDLFARAAGASLPSKAFYVGGSDLEGFYGVRTPEGIRFPVSGDYEWYLRRVVPTLEPRLQFGSDSHPGLINIIERAYQQGFQVYSSDRQVLESTHHPVELRGLFWVMGKTLQEPFSEETVKAAADLCRALEQSDAVLQPVGHHYSRLLWSSFVNAFSGAAERLRQSRDDIGFRLASKVSVAIADSAPAAERAEACVAFRAHCQDRFTRDASR